MADYDHDHASIEWERHPVNFVDFVSVCTFQEKNRQNMRFAKNRLNHFL